MNLPNRLTLLRILLIPVFIVFASPSAIPARYLIAFAVFSIASFTDYLDGNIARKRNMVTDFGKFADPLADKLLTTVAFLYMMQDGVCHILVLVIILLREFAVSGVRMVAAGAKKGTVIAANMWGKVKTVLQMVSIIAYYLLAGINQLVALPVDIVLITNILCWLVAVITAVSGVQYMWAYRSYINTAK